MGQVFGDDRRKSQPLLARKLQVFAANNMAG
jgi:hypothetical protein